ncbi:MAG TPA: class I SAM-dependent methyltransferase [Steroidobacteraceae bacterium]|nr:class I SAM-dependent methyltransferase [Steroidobacteraceae bacterium]
MSVRGTPAPSSYVPDLYWEDRARRFAGEGAGLAAVCAYGMPLFYNRAIDWEQRLALVPWLRVARGARVLDIGCGVGRWSRLLALRGAVVTGVDISPTMIDEARRRAGDDGVADRCRFRVGDAATLDVEGEFDLILAVTVLQHILDPGHLRAALVGMRSRLAAGGRIVLLEAAPTMRVNRCDTTVFRARPRASYLDLFRECELQVSVVAGVDPAPWRSWLLPHLRSLPQRLSMALIALATVLSLPTNGLLGRWCPRASWHAVFVLRARPGRV